MSTREYALIVATMRALSPYYIGAEEMNRVAGAIEVIRPDFDRLDFLKVVQP